MILSSLQLVLFSYDKIELEKRKAEMSCAHSSLAWYLFTAGCDVLDDDAFCSSSSCVGQRLREQHTTQA